MVASGSSGHTPRVAEIPVTRRILRALSEWQPKDGPWAITEVRFHAGWGGSTVVTVSVGAEHPTPDTFDRPSQDALKAIIKDAAPTDRLIIEVITPI